MIMHDLIDTDDLARATALLQAAEHFRTRGLRPAIIEKDYYVTETLRIVAAAGDKVIFKGGTSLAKGWNLIQRFSEDIDIFLDPAAFSPALGKRGIDRELKTLRDAIAEHGALMFLPDESQTIGRAELTGIRGPGSECKSPLTLAGLFVRGTARGMGWFVLFQLSLSRQE